MTISPTTKTAAKIRVLVIDDSALVRKILTEIIDGETDMEVVGVAPDPHVAREKIKSLNPDVLTLDVEMPKMDGLVFLEKLMRLRPMPVVMVSSLTERGSLATLRALELGAVDFVSKPRVDIRNGLEEYRTVIIEKIRIAAGARLRAGKTVKLPVEEKLSADAVIHLHAKSIDTTEKIIAVGASTGGTEALREFLTGMPADSPGILITQHMPEAFTKSFAARLNSVCAIAVKEAEHRERILPGHAYIAPGNRHLLLSRSGANYVVELSDGPPVSRHRPSVDVLFRSVANCGAKNAIGVILTGMGDDGAEGMLEMKRAGAFNLAQDENSCVVFGMPKEAIARGGVDEILPLERLSQRITNHLASLGKRGFRV